MVMRKWVKSEEDSVSIRILMVSSLNNFFYPLSRLPERLKSYARGRQKPLHVSGFVKLIPPHFSCTCSYFLSVRRSLRLSPACSQHSTNVELSENNSIATVKYRPVPAIGTYRRTA